MSAQDLKTHPAVVNLQNGVNYRLSQLDKGLQQNFPVLNAFEERTQIPKTYAVIGTVVLLGLLLLVNPLASPVSNLIGWALPAYLSFKAIESPATGDDTQWLTYWVVFGAFNFLESFALRLVLYYFPWYFTFKTGFVLWLQLPQFRGAQVTYHAILKPVVANAAANSPALYNSQPAATSPHFNAAMTE